MRWLADVIQAVCACDVQFHEVGLRIRRRRRRRRAAARSDLLPARPLIPRCCWSQKLLF